MSGVLFVCTGNMCRSPLAAAKFKAMMDDYGLTGWDIGSAGTWIENGLPADPRTIAWADENGLPLSQHTTRQVSDELLSAYDLIVVMEEGHKEAITTDYSSVNGKIIGLSELSGPFYNVPDPISLTEEEFDVIAKEVVSLVKKGFNEIINRLVAKHKSLEPQRRN